ncbi:glycosyltransferase family 4 protein, partial [Petrachloros mirabilis]
VARRFKKLALWSLRQMDQIVVIGRCMERRLLSDGIPSQSISRISNWADGELIRSVPRTENEFIQEHGLQGKFVVMYSGNLGVVHEFDTVMTLIRDLQAVPNLVFCFIGQGRRKDPLVATAARENWQHVLCLPYQPKASLPASLSAADIHLVSLRSDMEGLSVPSKLYGILAVGRPVLFIGPTNSEAAAVIRDARCGYVVQPGDVQGAAQAILAGYHNRALLEKQGQQARRYFAQHCDRSLATERFQQVFERVCETSPRTSMALKTISPSSRSH